MKNLDFKNIYSWPFKQQLIIFILVFVVVLYLGYWWDLSSLNMDLNNGRQQEADLKQQIELVIAKEQAVRADISELPQLENLLSQWQKKLILHASLPELLNEILKYGANNHLYFAQFNPGDEKKVGSYLQIPIKTIVVGSYHQIGDFMSQVANLSWIVTVGDFTISNENKPDLLGQKLAEQANAQNLLTAEINLQIYFQPENKKP